MFIHMIDRKIWRSSPINQDDKMTRREALHEGRQAGRDECCPAWRTHQYQSSARISEGQDKVEPLSNMDRRWKWLSQPRIQAHNRGYRRLHRNLPKDQKVPPKPGHQLYQSAVSRTVSVPETWRKENKEKPIGLNDPTWLVGLFDRYRQTWLVYLKITYLRTYQVLYHVARQRERQRQRNGRR